MYELFSITFFLISFILITLIILTPSKSNIIGSPIHIDNIKHTIITPHFLKNTLNFSIIIISLIFYFNTILLNFIHNKKINKWNNLINQNTHNKQKENIFKN